MNSLAFRRTASTAALVVAGMFASTFAQSSVAPDVGARKLQDRLTAGVVMAAPSAPRVLDVPLQERPASAKADRGAFETARLHPPAAEGRTVTIENRIAPNVSELVRMPVSDVPLR
jgi:hypothetical protein